MKKIMMILMLSLFTGNVLAAEFTIPDPSVIHKKTNALLDVETFRGGHFSFYFVSLKELPCTYL